MQSIQGFDLGFDKSGFEILFAGFDLISNPFSKKDLDLDLEQMSEFSNPNPFFRNPLFWGKSPKKIEI